MQRGALDAVARCSRRASLALLLIGAFPGSDAWCATFGGPLEWPLARPARVLTGGFGEPRSNHFHAGLDLSTSGRVGAAVLAPADAWLERVRTSGVGYGRSIYLRTDDDRLLVFGHLDTFSTEVAAHVDSVQRSTGDYEQDLRPPVGRFRYAAGTRVGWTGQSGAGGPHLHMEVRHGDFALNPLLAGLAVPDSVPPRLERLILEPLDEHSWVERGAAPQVHVLRAREDTLVVEGRARLTLVAVDATNSSRGLPVHTLVARWEGTWVECRMDSVSWVGEMSQSGWLLDRGRVTGSDGVILDAPAGWRPRFLASSRPERLPVELVQVAAGAPAHPLELYARDAAGHEVTRRVWLRGPLAHERGPASRRSPTPRRRATKARATAAAPPRWEFACLPDQRVRVRVSSVDASLGDVRIERGLTRGMPDDGADATWDGVAWSAVLHASGTPDPEGLWIKGRLSSGKEWLHRGAFALWPTATPMVGRVESWASFSIEPDQAYESGVVMARAMALAGIPAGATGVRAALHLLPVQPPLRRPARVTLALPADVARDHVGLYRRDDDRDRWAWADADFDSARRSFGIETDRLGQFALLRDVTPPAVTLLAAPARARGSSYSTWALTARVTDTASGVVGRASGFTVDGVRVPTEWDAEQRLLRWRPLAPPAPGRHAYRVEAVDRAGNRKVRSGVFVIASR